jgi:hypothetical protein
MARPYDEAAAEARHWQAARRRRRQARQQRGQEALMKEILQRLEAGERAGGAGWGCG